MKNIIGLLFVFMLSSAVQAVDVNWDIDFYDTDGARVGGGTFSYDPATTKTFVYGITPNPSSKEKFYETTKAFTSLEWTFDNGMHWGTNSSGHAWWLGAISSSRYGLSLAGFHLGSQRSGPYLSLNPSEKLDESTYQGSWYQFASAINGNGTWVAKKKIQSTSWLTDQLVAYYPFENNADDQSGHENDGAVNGHVGYVKGAVGKGVKLNGVNSLGGVGDPDYIRVPNSSSLQFSNQLTLSYWVKIDGNRRQTSENCSGDIVRGIYGSVLGKSGDRHGFSVSETEFTSDFGINIYSGSEGHKQTAVKLASSAFGKFRFVTYTIKDGLINVYMDGVLIRSEQGNVSFDQANNEDLYIGVQTNDVGSNCAKFWYPLDGVIDELRLYSRPLSSTEIKVLYQCENLSVATCNSYAEVETLLEAAVGASPSLFEKGRETFAIIGYWAQYYPGTNTYLGAQNGRFYGYSVERWGGMIDFGSMDALLAELNNTGTLSLKGL